MEAPRSQVEALKEYIWAMEAMEQYAEKILHEGYYTKRWDRGGYKAVAARDLLRRVQEDIALAKGSITMLSQ